MVQWKSVNSWTGITNGIDCGGIGVRNGVESSGFFYYHYGDVAAKDHDVFRISGVEAPTGTAVKVATCYNDNALTVEGIQWAVSDNGGKFLCVGQVYARFLTAKKSIVWAYSNDSGATWTENKQNNQSSIIRWLDAVTVGGANKHIATVANTLCTMTIAGFSPDDSFSIGDKLKMCPGLVEADTHYYCWGNDTSNDPSVFKYIHGTTTWSKDAVLSGVTFTANNDTENAVGWRVDDKYYILLNDAFYRATSRSGVFEKIDESSTVSKISVAWDIKDGTKYASLVGFDDSVYEYNTTGKYYNKIAEITVSGCGWDDWISTGTPNEVYRSEIDTFAFNRGEIDTEVQTYGRCMFTTETSLTVNQGLQLYDDNGTGLFDGNVGKRIYKHPDRWYPSFALEKWDFDVEITKTYNTGIKAIVEDMCDTYLTYISYSGTIGDYGGTYYLEPDNGHFDEMMVEVADASDAIWYIDEDRYLHLHQWDDLIDSTIVLDQSTGSTYQVGNPTISQIYAKIVRVKLNGGINADGELVTAEATTPGQGMEFLRDYPDVTDQTTLTQMAADILQGTARGDRTNPLEITFGVYACGQLPIGQKLTYQFSYLTEVAAVDTYYFKYVKHNPRTNNCIVTITNGILQEGSVKNV